MKMLLTNRKCNSFGETKFERIDPYLPFVKSIKNQNSPHMCWSYHRQVITGRSVCDCQHERSAGRR
jgi:hypothetical protein